MSERTPDQPAEAAPTQPPSPPTTSGVVDSGLGPLTAIAVADLATRLDIDEQDVSVVSAEVLVWPDGSLGCPQPGMAYPQVQVDGFRIVLAARGLEFDYHGGGSRGPFLCEGAVG